MFIIGNIILDSVSNIGVLIALKYQSMFYFLHLRSSCSFVIVFCIKQRDKIVILDENKRKWHQMQQPTIAGNTINFISSTFLCHHNFFAKHEVKIMVMLVIVNLNTLLWTITVE